MGPEASERPMTCRFIPKIVVHVVDGFWLIVILIAQETIINYYIIMRYQESVYPYFFFAVDFICLCTFVCTLCVAYTNLKKTLLEDIVDAFGGTRRQRYRLPLNMGESPLSYLSWIFYSIIFILKIVLIFYDGTFIRSLSVENHFGPQLLKVGNHVFFI